jgi:hypothetical protein
MLFILFSLSVPAQDSSWPSAGSMDSTVFYGTKNVSPRQYLKGYVILKNGDSLTGYMTFAFHTFLMRHNRCILLQRNNDAANWISPQKIAHIKVEAASFNRGFSTLYSLPINHPKNAFWRLIADSGAVAIYDRNLGIFSHLGRWEIWQKYLQVNMSADEFNENLYMISNGVPIKIYGSYGIYKARDRPAELIVQFINERYHQSFKTTDFKTKMDMIVLILQKENNLLEATHSPSPLPNRPTINGPS